MDGKVGVGNCEVFVMGFGPYLIPNQKRFGYGCLSNKGGGLRSCNTVEERLPFTSKTVPLSGSG